MAEPEIIISYFIKDKRLFGKINMRDSEFEVFYLSELNKILDDRLEYGTIVQDNDETVIKFNSYNLKRKD